MALFPKKFIELQKDEYVDRILCSVAGMTPRYNLYLMDKGIASMPDNTDVLEIGSFAGQSAILLHYFMRKHQKKGRVICIDPYIFEGWEDTKNENNKSYLNSVGNQVNLQRTDYLTFIENSFKSNVQFFCPENTPHLYKFKSKQFFERFKNGMFPELEYFRPGFCYIDGNHSYENAILDTKNCIAISHPKALILMDDTASTMKLGSVDAGKEIKKWKELELIAENPNLLFKKR